jgi:adenosylhomocysteine nucleosidase
MTKESIRLGIISALHEEQRGLIDAMQERQVKTRGMREYASGKLWGLDTVCVLSRIGKVAAAATAATLIEHFGVTHLLFTGVAGGAGEGVCVGDIVVGEELVQHDMDSSPLFPRFEIPLTGVSLFAADSMLSSYLVHAASGFLKEDFAKVIHAKDCAKFNLTMPRVHHGLIASGDQFIAHSGKMDLIRQDLPATLAVEMEGAAVAQVCFEFGVPFAVVRTISDSANETSPVDFGSFIQTVAAHYAFHIVRRTCQSLNV